MSKPFDFVKAQRIAKVFYYITLSYTPFVLAGIVLFYKRRNIHPIKARARTYMLASSAAIDRVNYCSASLYSHVGNGAGLGASLLHHLIPPDYDILHGCACGWSVRDSIHDGGYDRSFCLVIRHL